MTSVPSICPHCGAPVERERYDRGVWRVWSCTGCPWGTSRQKDEQ